MAQLYIVLALIVLVVLHELGHFLAARAVGIRATKFYVFFPPALLKRTVGDVEYGIGAIPAGGFVKLPGMFEPVPAEIAERLRWEFEDIDALLPDGRARLRLDAARRVIANAASPDEISEPLRDVLELLAELEARGVDPEARRSLEQAEATIRGIVDPPVGSDRLAELEARAAAFTDEGRRSDYLGALRRARGARDDAARDTAFDDARDVLLEQLGEDALGEDERRSVRRVRDRVQGMLDDAHPQAYWRAALWRRMAVIFAGPFVNLAVAFIVLTGFIWLYSPVYDVVGPLRATAVEAGSPAKEAGIEEGARITGWNGSVVGTTREQLAERIVESRGEPVELEWTTSDGDERSARVTPERLDADDEYDRLGVGLSLPESAVEVSHEVTSLGNGVELAWFNIERITVDSLTRLPRVLFDAEVREDVGSVVGIVDFADEVDQAGLIVHYVAVISLILAVMNLLPLLPLDGGHLLFGLLEAVRRGRPMPRAAFERYSLIGIALVLVLFMIGLDNDIDRIRG